MGGSGFAIDMIRKVKANRALRKERINRYKRSSASIRQKKSIRKQKLLNKRDFRVYTNEERRRLREAIKRTRKRESFRSWILTLIISFILVGLGYWLVKTIGVIFG